ncbi:Zn-ribbon domain-containing OB-fold protein [Streptomyces iconiensis]|uniref:Zn-ribbon domain-containing OB-fold protein n=1 Tax=Streptomyces iconiensis TaxID=1384038 RepID=A0ABT7A4E7_9ACTN|nr:Zn-ribbon domain-containing OB-fold protein [Streptomyces iconiensis]MDJ1136195.1 Zn-ribbon domain-containing OB-fold protein [Streptomyces iconiensis]
MSEDGSAQHPEEGSHDELYESLRAYEGRTAATAKPGKDPVNEPMIRHWCEAMGHPVPPDGTAPATMLQVWTMAGLGAAHMTDQPYGPYGAYGASGDGQAGGGRGSGYVALLEALDDAGYTSVVATDCEQEYARPLRPGDTVTFDSVIESVSPRKTTKLGTGYFVTTRMDLRTGGEPVGSHRFRILKYRPAHAHTRSTTGENAATTGENVATTGGGSTGNATTGNGTTGIATTGDATTESATTGPGSAGKGGGAREPRRPRPVVNRDNAGFWEGVSAHKLLVQRCDDCGTPRFPWLPGCNACGSADWSAFEAAGRGTVYSYVVMHHPAFPAFDPPYAVALVELEEGVRIVSNITGVACEKVRIGMPVELEFLRVDDELELPVFRGAGAA